MKYQLRRMVLVNAGTNKHVPSARLTEIDPRGGVAVLGENGVGKTTTLRIIPLFFGHQPSQIVATGQGQENMIKFLLPTDASAIVFEYQRGSERVEDLRTVVLRRRVDDAEVGFYRIFHGGFQRDLFVKDGRFLSDDQSLAQAGELGVRHTKMLTPAEYRCIILRTSSSSKDRDKLRSLAHEHSYGPRQLDNLDKLVAAMVKNKINFNDILQVAVSMVQHGLGQGAERNKISFKQGPMLITRWLQNREACAEAQSLQSKMDDLKALLTEHRHQVARLRARRCDVRAMDRARSNELDTLRISIGELETHRSSLIQRQRSEREEFDAACKAAQSALQEATRHHEEFKSRTDRLELERASHWAGRIGELFELRQRKSELMGQLSVAKAGQDEVVAQYARLQQEAVNNTKTLKLQLEQDKQPLESTHRDTLSRLAASETTERQEAQAAFDVKMEDLEARREPLLSEKGAWEGRKQRPSASDASVQAVTDAEDKLSVHTDAVHTAQNDVARAMTAATASRRALDEHEIQVRRAREAFRTIEADAAQAQARITPAPGTLLAVLRGASDLTWQRTLAKILAPDLLQRKDLDPRWLDDATSLSAYGWSLDTGAVDTPDWVNDQRAKDVAAEMEERRGAAQAQLDALIAQQTPNAQADKLAQENLNVEQARLSVLQGQTEALKSLRNAARQKVIDERAQVAQEADVRLKDLQRRLDQLTHDKQAARRELDAHLADVQRRVAAQRSEAQQRREEAMQKINDAIGKADGDLAVKKSDLQRQQDAQLSLQGVNVDHLRQLQGTHDAVHVTIEELESKQPLVDRLEKWQAEGGAPHLEDLLARKSRATETSSGALERLNAFEKAATEATRLVVEGLTQANRRKVEVESDRMTLEALDALFGEHAAEGDSVIDPAMGVLELKGLVQEALSSLEKLDDRISKAFKSHRQRLTARGGDVAELIEAGLHETRSDPVAKAMSLCDNYDQISPQIVTNLNITLAAILSNVGAFQKQMRTFESEVSAFNAKLQKGLIEVQSFERIKNMEVVIRTNFETLGFYKKLTLMQDVMRQEASVVGRDNAKHLPTKETANALGEFAVVLEKNGDLEVNLSRHISLQGSVEQNGERKAFRNATEFEHISSEGLTSLILITVMTALLNTIRSNDPVHVPWVTDEVGKFSASNFLALITMLRDNKIDVITASPELGPAQQAVFSKRYLFEDRGRIREFTPTARMEALA